MYNTLINKHYMNVIFLQYLSFRPWNHYLNENHVIPFLDNISLVKKFWSFSDGF